MRDGEGAFYNELQTRYLMLAVHSACLLSETDICGNTQ